MNNFIAFILGIGAMILMSLAVAAYDQMNKLKYIKQKILNNYGKEIDLDEVMIKMNSVSSYFRNKNEKSTIDDITWNDLSMDDIFKKINNTQSTAGAEVLYDILRNPLYEKSKLEKRNNLIEYFRNNEKIRREVQYTIGKLGESNDLFTSNCLFNQGDTSENKLLKYRLLSYLPIVSLLLISVSGYFFILLVGSLILNFYISQNNKKYQYNIDGFTYMLSVVKTANKIKSLGIRELEDNLESIEEDLEAVKDIKNKNIGYGNQNLTSDISVFSEYTKLIFLTDLKNYEKVKNTVIKKAKHLDAIYQFIGSIDALIGVASFRDSLDYYCIPSLIKTSSKGENTLEFTDIYHPLIKSPVPNSGKFERGILLTGSNASGKSTFIKTVAVNAILAQTIYTTTARDYNSSYFNIYTSMALKDDIFRSESYYIVEIKSLKRILDNMKEDVPCLCFVDEILRGTNTVERISSSCEVLSFLGQSNCICFAATHDIELTHLLEEKFDNYHFEEIITNKDIEFDYRLHKGRAQTRNAIKLLEFMGYDEDIVERAENRAKIFLDIGKW
ncbi:MutS-related protein [Romboutsia sp.]|uniref:MutS-related protein n=1 Tax=Romboutsia sp. TaxID=1965302 RepID=UPI003F3BAEEA